MSTFAITAMGRSGTKFLAQVMNESKQWTVRHEPSLQVAHGPVWSRPPLVTNVELVQKRFDQDYYGEVNSYLRHVLMALHVNYTGVIIRDPHDILVSAMNRPRPRKMTSDRIDLLALGYQALDYALCHASVWTISFERMTTDVSYLRWMLQRFGIEDVSPTQETLNKKVNATTERRYEQYEDIPAQIRHYYEAQTEWYREKRYVPTT